MEQADLWQSYPVLFHVAWGGSWPSIQQNGLLSSKSLLRLYGKNDSEIDELTKNHRPHWVRVSSTGRPDAVLRDQKPLSDAGLIRALGGTAEPFQWYDLINSMVFFWPTRKRIETMVRASAYANVAHDVLVVDTQALVELEASNIRLSSMNSGCTRPVAHPRDLNLFKTIEDFPFDYRRSRYGAANAVAEICVLDRVQDISDVVLNVEHGFTTEILERIAVY